MQRSFGFYHEVLTDYARKLIRRKAKELARRVDFVRSDEEDIAQELTMHLLTQADRFDPNRAAPSTFAAAVIQSGIGMLLRKRNRQCRRPADVEIQSLDVTVEKPGESAAPLESIVSVEDGGRRIRNFPPSDVEQFDNRDAFDHAYHQLPEHLLSLCQELMTVSPNLAARNLGLSRSQMFAAMETLRAQFTSAGFCRS